MAMKIVIVKDATTDHLVPLTLKDTDSIADLIRQWSTACGRDGSEYIFKTIDGEVLSGEVLISELDVPLSGYSSLEIIAERTARLFVCIKGPGCFGGKMLEIQLALSFTIAPLASVVCQVLQIPDQELEFRSKAPVNSTMLQLPLRSDVSLADLNVQEDEEIDCDFSFDFVVSSSSGATQHRLTCRGGTKVAELLDPDLPVTKQRLLFDGRCLDNDADLVSLLMDDLAHRLKNADSRSVRLLLEHEVSVSLAGEVLTAWSGETVRDWLGRLRPQILETPLWHHGTPVSLDALVTSLLNISSKEPIVLELDAGLHLTVVDGECRQEVLLHSNGTVDQLMQRLELEAESGLFMTLENGRRLSPGHAGLIHCGVESGSTVILRRPTEELLLEFEGWSGRLPDMPKSASFSVLLEAARSATGRVLDDDCVFVCRCGRSLSNGSSLPSCPPCCPLSPRLLVLHRRLWVTVATDDDPQFLRLRRRATDSVHDLLLDVHHRLRGRPRNQTSDVLHRFNPDNGLKRRLCHRGDVQCRSTQLFELDRDAEVTVTLQEEVIFIVENKTGFQLCRVWPDRTWIEVRRLLEEMKMLNDSESLLLHGEVVKDEDIIQMKNGDVVRIVETKEAAGAISQPVSTSTTRTARSQRTRESSPQSFAAAVSRHGTTDETTNKSSMPLATLPNARRGKTTVVVTKSSLAHVKRKSKKIRMTSDEGGEPPYPKNALILEMETPLTVGELRSVVADRWKCRVTDVSLEQRRVFCTSKTICHLVEVWPGRWADSCGAVFNDNDVCQVTTHFLFQDQDQLMIPGSHSWVITARARDRRN